MSRSPGSHCTSPACCRYGHLTWEWAAGIRSYVHPLLFALPYALLKGLHLDSTWAITRVPLLVQALAAAATDLYVVRLADTVLLPHAARQMPPVGQQGSAKEAQRAALRRWCLVCQLASWFNAYCLVRTYSNSLEALAAAAGAFHWLAAGSERQLSHRTQGPIKRQHQRAWIACAALSIIVRPSSALFWALPAAVELVGQRCASGLLLDAITLGGGLWGIAAVIDRMAYGR
jgi:phosphatidylinositol glycan class B